MLMLGRKTGESIIVGTGDNAVRITVVKITNDTVRLGCVGPASVPVDREEIRQRKDQSNDR